LGGTQALGEAAKVKGGERECAHVSPGDSSVVCVPWEAAAAGALEGLFPELLGRCAPGEL
jgi:hypothetical protein